jgi:transcriptional regulator with XRE-family HTH domain
MARLETASSEAQQMQNFGTRMQEAREAKGYGWEELAVATGLTVEELQDIEHNVDGDSGHIQRVASVLQVDLTPPADEQAQTLHDS